LKKLLTALLVVAMVLGLATVAFAADFSDTKDLGKDAQASISKLSGLEIINGYPDGTFKPGNSITRAEFAKIATIAGGMGASADVLQNSPSQYTDVAASQWYTGYINLASSQGWVKGYPDGTFRPNSQITYAEVITVLVRLLGYNDNLPGPWPVDYIAKAGALDVTKNVSFNANAPATRGDVAVMADATLDCAVVNWDNDKEDFVYKQNKDYTLLDDSFDSAINEDYQVTGVTYDKGAWYINVSDVTDKYEKADELPGKIELAKNCVLSNAALPIDLGSKIVDILYNDDDEVATYIEVTSTTVKVDGEDWKVTKEYTKDGKDYVSQYEIDGDKYDVADWAEIEVEVFDKDGYYTAYINSDDEVYKVSAANKLTPAIVEEYDDGELTVKDEGNYGDYKEIEKIDFEDDDVLIKKAGKFVDPEELEENDIIYVEEKYGFDYYIEVAGSLNKTGNLDAVKSNSIRIDRTWYDLADLCLISDDAGDTFADYAAGNLDDSDDETITYFLNKANQVCYIITSEVGDSNKIYGVVTDLGYRITKSGNMVTDITVLTAEGTEVDYDVDTSEVEFYMPKDGLDEEFLEELYFVKFAVNDDNEIDSLTILSNDDPDDDTINGGNDDNNRVKVNDVWYKVTDKTVVFNGAGKVDDAEVVKNADFIDWADGKGKGASAYVQISGTEIEYVYLNETKAISGADADYALILSNYTKGGDYWVEIDVRGDSLDYELKGNARPTVDAIYDYSISSSKFSGDPVFDPDDNRLTALADKKDVVESIVDSVYCYKVQDVDRSANAVKVNNEWLYADDNVVIYDYTDYYADGDDPEYASSIRSISKGDYIVYAGAKDEVELFIIVTNIEFAAK